MPPIRQGYNAKARQSTSGTRKKGKLKKRKEQQAEAIDSNAEIIVQKPTQEKELDKRERLRQEVCKQKLPRLA